MHLKIRAGKLHREGSEQLRQLDRSSSEYRQLLARLKQLVCSRTPDMAFHMIHACMDEAGRGLFDAAYPRSKDQKEYAAERMALLRKGLEPAITGTIALERWGVV